MARTMFMGTSKWVAVPLNVHSIHEMRKLYISLKVIYLGHNKFSVIQLGSRLCCKLKVQTWCTGFNTRELF